MFRFNFPSNFDLNQFSLVDPSTTNDRTSSNLNNEDDKGIRLEENLRSSREVEIDSLFQVLPSVISFSSVCIPLRSSAKYVRKDGSATDKAAVVKLLKRDLFDARFQVISKDTTDDSRIQDERVSQLQDTEWSADTEKFVSNPSDLVPGIYEGGLKTWECSLDLIEYLETSCKEESGSWVGCTILDVGCGTAMPSAYMLREVFSYVAKIPPGEAKPTEFYLQDYNNYVLELVSFPNILLAWYSSTLSAEYRATTAEDTDTEVDLHADFGELPITINLLAAFRNSLRTYNISMRFFSGSWDGLHANLMLQKSFDLIISSETIYQQSSLPSFIDLIQRASKHPRESKKCLCLVCAKILYFGVGGGILEFERMVKKLGGNTETIFESRDGVGRQIVSVSW